MNSPWVGVLVGKRPSQKWLYKTEHMIKDQRSKNIMHIISYINYCYIHSYVASERVRWCCRG